MSHYFYQCFNCKKEFSSELIEENLIYLCPDCGKAERNKPLEGVLIIKYDYDQLKKKLSREALLNKLPGQIWKFPEILPLKFNHHTIEILSIDSNLLDSLTLNCTPVIKLNYDDFNLLALDETRNPTFSYKDRASILVALKAIQMGITQISAASTGNAGSSIAGICARLGIRSNIFVPRTIPDSKRLQIQSYGANLFVVDGSYDDAFDLCLEISSRKKWFNRNTAYNPLTLEGKKSGAYDIFISTKGNLPDKIFVPVGDGVIIGGLYKGFLELLELGFIDQLPELIAVQSSRSNAVARYFQTRKFDFMSAQTIADSICAAAPRNLYMAYKAIKNTNGFTVEVSDSEILEAQKRIIQKFGIFVEPSSASSFAAFEKIKSSNQINTNDKILLLFTGNGLKDMQSISNWNEDIKPKKYEELLDEFLK